MMNRHDLCETLESRRLFAITLVDGLLTVDGTAGNDTISLTSRGGTLTVRNGAERADVALADVDDVVVNALAGDDRVTLATRLDVPATIDGGDGNDRLTGGAGDDLITGGGGNDRLAGGRGDDDLVGAAGNDRLLGGAGDDFLAGGDGFDLLTGGAGFDSAEAGDDDDAAGSIEDFGDVTIGDGGLLFDDNPFLPLDDLEFALLREAFLPFGTRPLPASTAVGVTPAGGGAVIPSDASGAFDARLGVPALDALFLPLGDTIQTPFTPDVGVTPAGGGAVTTLQQRFTV
jgi:hypothetical protein